MPVFLTIILISILGGVEVDIFIPSFPELQKVFNLSPFLVQLTLSVNFIAYCLCSLFAGALGDRFNRRQVVLISLLVFVIGSLLCVFAINFPLLVIGRFLQGAGMAGPVVLAYAIIADIYPPEKLPGLMGMLNGLTSGSMAFAPVIGSFVNYYFSWHANFVVLLVLSAVSLILGYRYIPDRHGDPNISLSPQAYVPLLRSTKLMTFIIGFCFLATTYWVFVGMAPILYMHALGVSLREFGFYQGVLAASFSVISLTSGYFFHRFGQKRCFQAGLWLMFVSFLWLIGLTLFDVRQAWMITAMMVLFSIAVVFPINILFPLTVSIIENTKGRSTALMMAVRLLMTAVGLEVASYFYRDNFLSLGVTLLICSGLSLYFIQRVRKKGWVVLES